MTITIYTFMGLVMGAFSFGVAVGVCVCLLGILWAARTDKSEE